MQRNHGIELGYAKAPPPAQPVAPIAPVRPQPVNYDFFLSHASEDKEDIARPLYKALIAAGVTVWFDEAVLKLGDRLRQKIEEGLSKCRYGIVVISASFLNKNWTSFRRGIPIFSSWVARFNEANHRQHAINFAQAGRRLSAATGCLLLLSRRTILFPR
jgi:hypothetical protein